MFLRLEGSFLGNTHHIEYLPDQGPGLPGGPRAALSSAGANLPSRISVCPHLSFLRARLWPEGTPRSPSACLAHESVISELGLEIDSVTLAGTSSALVSLSPSPRERKTYQPYYRIEIH